MVRIRHDGSVSIAVLFLLGMFAMTTMGLVNAMENVPPEKLGTVAGPFEIGKKEELPPPDFSKHKLLLSGKVIAELRDEFVDIEDAYPDATKAKLILLGLGTGGSGCPGFFRVLEIKPDGNTILTDKFGTCSDVFKTAYRDGTWDISVAAFTEQRGEWEHWQYRDGKLTQNGKPVVNADDPEWGWQVKLQNAVPDARQREALIKKYGSAFEAYRAWLTEEAQRKVHPEQFR